LGEEFGSWSVEFDSSRHGIDLREGEVGSLRVGIGSQRLNFEFLRENAGFSKMETGSLRGDFGSLSPDTGMQKAKTVEKGKATSWYSRFYKPNRP
jgi:hypothetical protein